MSYVLYIQLNKFAIQLTKYTIQLVNNSTNKLPNLAAKLMLYNKLDNKIKPIMKKGKFKLSRLDKV